MEKDLQEIFLNQHPMYMAGFVYETFDAARTGCGESPQVKTVKFVRVPEEEIVRECLQEKLRT